MSQHELTCLQNPLVLCLPILQRCRRAVHFANTITNRILLSCVSNLLTRQTSLSNIPTKSLPFEPCKTNTSPRLPASLCCGFHRKPPVARIDVARKQTALLEAV